MKKILSLVLWGLGISLVWLLFEVVWQLGWPPHLFLILIILLGLYAPYQHALRAAWVFALLDLLWGSGHLYRLIEYPVLVWILHRNDSHLFRSHPMIFGAIHLGVIALDAGLYVLWNGVVTQVWNVQNFSSFFLLLLTSSAMAYLFKWTGFGFFEKKPYDMIWSRSPQYRL